MNNLQKKEKEKKNHVFSELPAAKVSRNTPTAIM